MDPKDGVLNNRSVENKEIQSIYEIAGALLSKKSLNRPIQRGQGWRLEVEKHYHIAPRKSHLPGRRKGLSRGRLPVLPVFYFTIVLLLQKALYLNTSDCFVLSSFILGYAVTIYVC